MVGHFKTGSNKMHNLMSIAVMLRRLFLPSVKEFMNLLAQPEQVIYFERQKCTPNLTNIDLAVNQPMVSHIILCSQNHLLHLHTSNSNTNVTNS